MLCIGPIRTMGHTHAYMAIQRSANVTIISRSPQRAKKKFTTNQNDSTGSCTCFLTISFSTTPHEILPLAAFLLTFYQTNTCFKSFENSVEKKGTCNCL